LALPCLRAWQLAVHLDVSVHSDPDGGDVLMETDAFARGWRQGHANGYAAEQDDPAYMDGFSAGVETRMKSSAPTDTVRTALMMLFSGVENA
jgi:hypothetical protein